MADPGMNNPNWRQFRAIPYDPTVAAVLKALDLEPPEEGRPTSFRVEGFLAAVTTAGDWVVLVDRGLAQFVDAPGDVLRSARLPQGTPSGDALRQWLRWWGWEPKPKQRQAEGDGNG